MQCICCHYHPLALGVCFTKNYRQSVTNKTIQKRYKDIGGALEHINITMERKSQHGIRGWDNITDDTRSFYFATLKLQAKALQLRWDFELTMTKADILVVLYSHI